MAQTITFTTDEMYDAGIVFNDRERTNDEAYEARYDAYTAQHYSSKADEEPDRTWMWVALGAAALFFFSPAGRAAEAVAQAVKAAVEAIAHLINAIADFISEHPVLSVLLTIAIVALIILL